ncbi:MAG: adenylyltransferase/cytidyltransferase family protein [Nanoarchaeota archaeon]|nr:adenylyltransferase/cytidyltransferase family protein [Nanoarchaeota archaeon]MBU1030982.1 adenylyltransferase/cytidyltransferase family protein [Nanoarchaeota archaeon]MBU1849893.1 adenylyltransferase/cytidyltransferase family protein [Nanoarchaeota archaeon]
MIKELGIAGFVGRFKPLHNGGALALDTLCDKADHLIIGIGSSNKYNLRNPYTPKESMEMIDAYLSQRHNNYSFKFVPDFAHLPEFSDGQKWREFVVKEFGVLDYFVSGNNYVKNLLENDYKIIHPASLIPREKWIKLRATEVRYEMALKHDWQRLVPVEVSDYIIKNSFDERFRDEFGKETIEVLANDDGFKMSESALAERNHTMEK